MVRTWHLLEVGEWKYAKCSSDSVRVSVGELPWSGVVDAYADVRRSVFDDSSAHETLLSVLADVSASAIGIPSK